MCVACPWRDMEMMTRDFPKVVLFAADHPGEFTCHTRRGPCDGPKFQLRKPEGRP